MFGTLLLVQGCGNEGAKKLVSDKDYLLLKDVFYVQSQVIQEKDKKEVRNILIKRGNEWHGPSYMRTAATSTSSMLLLLGSGLLAGAGFLRERFKKN